MQAEVFTLEQKIKTLDEIIVAERERAKANGMSARGSVRYQILKSIAADMQARQPHVCGYALEKLTSDIEAVRTSKTHLGYGAGNLQALANSVIGKWPTIRQALEKFEKDVQS